MAIKPVGGVMSAVNFQPPASSAGFDWSVFANPLQDIGYGLTQGNNIQSSLKAAGQRTAEMAQPRAAAEIMQRQEQERQRGIADAKAKVNLTVKTLRDAGYPQLAAMAEAGYGEQAYGQYLKMTQPGANLQEVNGQLVDVTTGRVVGDYRSPETQKPPEMDFIYDPVTGLEQKVMWDAARREWVPAGGTKALPASMGELSATETKQLFETEETILAANSVISALDTALDLNVEGKSRAGWDAEALSTVGANVPDWVPFIGGNEAVDTNTIVMKNIVTQQALNQLKAIFGAAPSNSEGKLLLEIQGSVNQPRDVRKRIYEEAKRMALIRLKFNEERKKRLETGGYGVVTPPPSGGLPPASAGGAFTILNVRP